MQAISMSQNKYKQLTKMNLPKEVFNTEAIIYDFRYKGEEKVFKKLLNNMGVNLANKLYTLEMLDVNRKYLPENLCIPDYLTIVGGVVEGFTMPKIEGINFSTTLKNKNITIEEKIYYLKKIGELLHQLEQIRKYTPFNDFYLNDIHESNFIVNPYKKTITAVDLDSSRVCSKANFASRYLTPLALLNNVKDKYKIIEDNSSSLGYVEADSNTDLYCYIIMILNYLYGENINNLNLEDFYNYLTYLEKIGINKELIEIFKNIVSNKDNENPYDLLDTLTTEQVARSRKIVYKK
ncbi:MAG TPA: hypothetical protein OIM65_03160 [Bacilli bacterium]|jgi:hypothetical protein|nr:hypothetical protein [Bacilli bacterium]